jgi:hypothetical protein
MGVRSDMNAMVELAATLKFPESERDTYLVNSASFHQPPPRATKSATLS